MDLVIFKLLTELISAGSLVFVAGTILFRRKNVLDSLFGQHYHLNSKDLKADDLWCVPSTERRVSWGNHGQEIAECIRGGIPFLLIGDASSGKRTALWDALRSADILASVLKLSPTMPALGEGGSLAHQLGASIPLRRYLFSIRRGWRKPHWIVLINFSSRVATESFFELLRDLRKAGLPIAATCRREDLQAIRSLDRSKFLENLRPIHISTLTPEQGERFCEELQIAWSEIQDDFPGTIGAIVNAGRSSRETVTGLSQDAQTLLRVLSDLRLCGLDDGDGMFRLAEARRLFSSWTQNAVNFDTCVNALLDKRILVPAGEFHRVSPGFLTLADENGQRVATEDLFRKVQAVFSADRSVLSRLGQEAKRQGFYDTAISCFEKWYQVDRNVFALLAQAGAYGHKKEYDKAIALAQEAVSIPIWKWWVRKRVHAYAHSNIGTYLVKKYESVAKPDPSIREAAVASFRRAQGVDSNYAPCWYELGAFYWRLGQYEDAEPCLAKGVELDRFENQASNWILEKVLEKNRKMSEAVALLREMESRTQDKVSRGMVLSQMSAVLSELYDKDSGVELLHEAIKKAEAAIEADRVNRFGWQNLIFSKLMTHTRLDPGVLHEVAIIYYSAKEAVSDVSGLTNAVRGSLRGWVRRRAEAVGFKSRADFDGQLAIWNTHMGPELCQTADEIRIKILEKYPEVGSLPGFQIVFGAPSPPVA